MLPRNRMLGLLCLDNQKRPICLGFAEHALRHSDSFPGQPCPLAGEGWGEGVATMRLVVGREPPPGATRRPPPQAGEVE